MLYNMHLRSLASNLLPLQNQYCLNWRIPSATTFSAKGLLQKVTQLTPHGLKGGVSSLHDLTSIDVISQDV